MSNPPAGAPDYFALFQSMFTPSGATPAPAVAPMFAMLDPKELERKINELETVLSWLKATTGLTEMSLQTMKYQQSLLASFTDNTSKPATLAKQSELEEFAKIAGAMNPALWAFNMMQAPQLDAKPPQKPEMEPATSLRRTAARKPKRK